MDVSNTTAMVRSVQLCLSGANNSWNVGWEINLTMKCGGNEGGGRFHKATRPQGGANMVLGESLL